MDKVNEVIEKENQKKEKKEAPVLKLIPNEDIGVLERGAKGVGGACLIGAGVSLDGVALAAGVSANVLRKAADGCDWAEEKAAAVGEAVKEKGEGWWWQFKEGYKAGRAEALNK